MRLLLLVLATTIGLSLGSFLTVVLYRIPRGISVVRPSSSCPSCGTVLAARHKVPVASWIVLRGRCGTCRTRISPIYPLVEVVAGIFFLTCASLLLPDPIFPKRCRPASGLTEACLHDAGRIVPPPVAR